MLEQTERQLLDLTQQLDALRHMANETAGGGQIPQDFLDVTATIADQVSSLQQEITELLPKLTNLTERFRKETINIGVSGKTGQGKSTLLQSISSLSNKEIPAASGLACTASKSMIYHTEGNPYARIDFYSEDEFLKEIIMPHFNKLDLPKPYLLRDFEEPLPEVATDRIIDQANYERLVKIHTLFPNFKHLLSTSKQVPLEEIRNYVIQEYPVSIAVKTAHVYTNFPNHDVTGLCLVDLPGLEAVLNHEIKLASSLEREVDAVIFLKQPTSTRAEWSPEDYKVLDLINESIKEIKLTDWLFIVLNELEDGSNAQQVQLLQENPPAKYSRLNMLVSQCKNPADVEQNVFAVVLNHLEQNLEEIDRVLLDSLEHNVEQIVNKATLELSSVVKFFDSEQDELGIFKEFKRLFEEYYDILGNILESLVVEVRERTYLDENQQNFLAKVESICDEAEQNPPVPSVEELANQYFPGSGWYGIVERTLPMLRAELAKTLAKGLDVFLEDMIENVYRDILVRALPETLRALVTPSGKQLTPREQMKAFYDLLGPQEHPKLRDTFEYVFKFDFSYQSHFHYRVRQQMVSLDPLMDASLVPSLIASDATKEYAPDVQRGLATMYCQAVSKIRKQFITEMQADPGNAIFALLEEIRDRLLRTERIKDEWETFAFLRRGEIWPKEFSQFDQQTALRKRWQNAINNILTHCLSLQNALQK
jgi:energy-coupling factor transporter ATP-binding protein EcfA2